MQKYHKIWLQAHPDRTAEWLKQKLAEGFDIHHVDENHENNHPDNLKLIEGTDHMRLHGLFRLKPRKLRDAKSPKDQNRFEFRRARLGGQARSAKLSAKRRREIARIAATARWQAKCVAAALDKT